MRNTPIGIVMLNDERKHVWEKNNQENMKVIKKWTKIIDKKMVHLDGTKPKIVVGSQIITSMLKIYCVRKIDMPQSHKCIMHLSLFQCLNSNLVLKCDFSLRICLFGSYRPIQGRFC